MEIQYVPLAQARRGNRAQVREWLATYTRLFADLTALANRLAAAGNPYTPASPSPEHLRKRLDRHFAPEADGFQSVIEMREAKLALENELAAAQGRLKGTLQDTRRRWRNLGESVRQTAASKTALLEFVEQTCLVELNPDQQQELGALAEATLQTFSLPEVTREAPPSEVTPNMLDGPEAHLAQAQQILQKAQADVQHFIEKVRAERAEEQRQKIVRKLSSLAKKESLQDFLACHASSPAAEALAEDHVQRKLDALLAEIGVLETTGGWQAIQKRAEEIRREREASRRLMLYEALVLDCDQRIRRLREYERWAQEMDELIDKAAVHSDQPGIQAMCDDLRQLRRSGTCANLKPLAARLEETLTAADKAAQREEKRRLLLQSLKSMGYAIIEGMETAMQTAGRIVVQRDGESEYAVEMVVNDDLSLVQTAMIRFGEAGEMTEQQRLRDKEKKESWCQNHAAMREKLAEHGLDATMKLHLQPGEFPVRVVQGSRRPAATVTGARRFGQRQMGT
ncbi:MAG: hypothetical protein WCL11_17450 [Verrucomicrobiota bacterium]